MPPGPNVTSRPTSRDDALAWAAHLRAVRQGVREQMSAGECTLEEALSHRGEPAVGAVRLLWVLESRPGARKIDTRRHLGRLGVGEDIPLADLGEEEVRLVLQEFASDPSEGALADAPADTTGAPP